ncbi:hypothetical protein [Nocardia sp. SSK8]|uniref:hypothetical protein n=1 Tax=Nocardia sp. SSK8 TaxID=3120154 RepID=UPI003008D01F
MFGRNTIRSTTFGAIRNIQSRDSPPLNPTPGQQTDSVGRYFASFVVETTDEPLPVIAAEVGVDLG